MTSDPQIPVLEVEHLTTVATRRNEQTTVVDDVSFTLMPGRALAVVGESGAGKSMLIRSVLGLYPPGMRAESTGTVRLAGEDLRMLNGKRLRRVLSSRVGMIHQDPLRSLNPTFRVGTQLTEALVFGDDKPSRRERRLIAAEQMAGVGFRDPEHEARRFPHELSGGQRQRIGIAAATLTGPVLLIGDEPTTALDVTVQKRVLDLMDRMRERLGSSLLLVTHDLGVAAERCDDILVMRAGKVVEAGPATQLLTAPQHPYTQALIDAIPRLDGPKPRRLRTIAEGALS